MQIKGTLILHISKIMIDDQYLIGKMVLKSDHKEPIYWNKRIYSSVYGKNGEEQTLNILKENNGFFKSKIYEKLKEIGFYPNFLTSLTEIS